MIFLLAVLAELWPVLQNCTVISKKEILYLGTFGLASWLWGTVFIDRVKPEEAQTTVNSTAEIIKNRKVIFYINLLIKLVFINYHHCFSGKIVAIPRGQEARE